jgi:alpha-amylase/alpha-mannosidase (GH57 family)
MDRIERALETRERESRAHSYSPPQQLPDPDPQDGYTFRWVRTHFMGQSDARNVAMMRREGYEPVRLEDHPEMAYIVDDPSKLSGNVEIGGLMLCKQLEEKTKARQAYYDELNRKQIQSVDNNFMRENDPRMPLFTEKRSEVSFSKR